MKRCRSLLDMDCVLADFVHGLALAHGTNKDALELCQPLGCYGYQHGLGCIKHGWVDTKPVTPAEFWEPINNTPGFWADLPALPWAKSLYRMCVDLAGGPEEVYVVTAPSRCPGCVREKEGWLHRHLGIPADRMIPTPHKHLMALWDSGTVALIDDSQSNVDAFNRAGGYGILFPALHNRLHVQRDTPLLHVETELRTLLS